MKRIATLFLAIVMLVSVMAPVSVLAATTYTDPSQILTVTKYTSENDTTGKVPEDETWIHVKSSGANGDNLNVGTEGWTSSDGVVSIPANARFKMTIGNSTTQLKTPFAGASDHLYTNAKGEDHGFIIYPGKAGITGTKTIKFWNMVHSTSNKVVGVEIKTSSMATPYTVIIDQLSQGNAAYWLPLSNLNFTFSGADDEYVKIYCPQYASDGTTTTPGSLRMSTVSFVNSTGAVVEKEVVTTPTFTTAADWTNADGVYSATADNSPATFTATNLTRSYYDVYYNVALTGNKATAPVVEFNIKDAEGAVVATHRYNTGDGSVAAGELFLGTYELSGAASVSATKIAGTEALKASSVRFEPNAYAVKSVNPTRETAIYKNQPSVASDKNYVLDTSDGTAAGTINPNYLNFLGEPAYIAAQPGVYQGYCTRNYRSNNGTVTAGNYDVWFYAIVDAETKAANDVKAYVYHNGMASGPINLNYGGKADGTKEWINLGTFYFSGNSINEYVSVGSDTARLRFGGVKFIPNNTVTDNREFHIVEANDSEKVTASPALSSWSTSSSVPFPVDGENHYYTALPGSTVTFSAADLTAGDWEVYYYHAPYYRGTYNDVVVNDSIDSENNQFIVKHNGITDAQNYDNSEGANQAQTNAKAWDWKYMGTYDFAGTGDESVTLVKRSPAVNEYGNECMRATAVKFVKAKEAVPFVVPVYKVAGANYTVSATLDGTDEPELIHEGLIPCFSASNSARTVRVTLPKVTGARAGKYKVSTMGVVDDGYTDSLSVTVVDKNGSHDETITVTNGAWKEIGYYDFTDDAETEYVQFNFPAATPQVIYGISAVKFEYVSASSATINDEISFNVAYGVALDSIVTEPVINKDTGEQETNADGSLKYKTQSVPVIVSVTNGKETVFEDTVVAYAAVYDAEDKFVTAKVLSGGTETIKSGKTSEHYGFINREWQIGDKLVTYIWDTDLTPLTATITSITTVVEDTGDAAQ